MKLNFILESKIEVVKAVREVAEVGIVKKILSLIMMTLLPKF